MLRSRAVLAIGTVVLLGPGGFGRAGEIPEALVSAFRPPPELAGDLGEYRSPLIFNDGRPVRDAAEWRQRRQEILRTWHEAMGAWPPLIEAPKLEAIGEAESRDGGITQQKVRVEVAPDDRMMDGYLLVPEGPGPFPAVLVVYYEPGTAIGLGKPDRDFGIRLARKGFVVLSIGEDPRPLIPEAAARQIQPLSYLAYIASNARRVLAQRPDVDPKRIAVMGHSYGGKWAQFAACLDEEFACGVFSDPGIVFDEARGNVNYWEPWYLGWEPQRTRKPGLITPEKPRTGAYEQLVQKGHDLHELLALMAPRPFLVSGGAEDTPRRWQALNHVVAVNQLLGAEDRVAMTNRPEHAPNPESNEQIDQFLVYVLKPRGAGADAVDRPEER